jgi:hypothetical protein
LGEVCLIVIKKFLLQKKVITIKASPQKRHSCRNSFKKLHIVPIISEYFSAIITFISDNLEIFHTNSEVHEVNARHKHDPYRPAGNMTVYYAGVKQYMFPLKIKCLPTKSKQFKVALKKFLMNLYNKK